MSYKTLGCDSNPTAAIKTTQLESLEGMALTPTVFLKLGALRLPSVHQAQAEFTARCSEADILRCLTCHARCHTSFPVRKEAQGACSSTRDLL
jgi:hypothetical protein